MKATINNINYFRFSPFVALYNNNQGHGEMWPYRFQKSLYLNTLPVNYYTIRQNSLYCFIQRNFEKCFGLKAFKNDSFHFSIDVHGLDLMCHVYASPFDGCYVLTSGCGFAFLSNKRFQLSGNCEFNETSVRAFLDKLICRYIYPTGVLSEIQERYFCDKKQAVEKYKSLLAGSKAQVFEVDIEKVYRKLLKKKNIFPDAFFSLPQLKAMLEKLGPFKKPTCVAPFSELWDNFFENFDGDVDQVESFFYANTKEDTVYF